MAKKIIIQCDFDGTLTNDDISFQILDKYATCDWRAELERYMSGEISVGQFNYNVFRSVKEDRATLIEYVKSIAETREGAIDFFDFCIQRNIDLQIVSNGLALYVNQIIGDLGYANLPIHAAFSEFTADGMSSVYYNPYGEQTMTGYKEGYSRFFLNQADDVIYIGNGSSDFPPAKLCHYVFATDDLSKLCVKNNVPFTHFDSFYTVIDGLKQRCA